MRTQGPPLRRIFLVVGTYKQFCQWRHDNRLGPHVDVINVSSPAQLLGVENPLVIYSGTFYLRNDLKDIEQIVRAMTR